MKKTREQIREPMHESRMHDRVRNGVAALASSKDIPVFFDLPFMLTESIATIPDYYFPTLLTIIFLDGSVHKGKQRDRDAELRALLASKGLKVVALEYNRYSNQEYERVMKEIKELIE